MNAAYRLLLAGAEAAERAASSENAALVYRTVAEQTNGEARTIALVGFLRCAIASRNAALLDQGIDTWIQATGSVFPALYDLVQRLQRQGNEAAALKLARREHTRQKSPESSYLCGLGLAAIARDEEMAVRAFREAEVHAEPGALREAAQIRRLAAAVRIPRRRRSALREAKELNAQSSRSETSLRLLAEIDLYAPSRFRRAAALQELATLAVSRGREQALAAYALRFYLECRGESLSPLELDRVNAYMDAHKRFAGLAAPEDRRVAPSAALRRRAAEVRSGAKPQEAPVDSSMQGLLLEFVAESLTSTDEASAPALHGAELLSRLAKGTPIDATYTFLCLEHIWRSPRLQEHGHARSIQLARAVLAQPGVPERGFLAFLGIAPRSLVLDLAFAARAAEEPGADLALLRAANTNDLEASYRVLRDIRQSLG